MFRVPVKKFGILKFMFWSSELGFEKLGIRSVAVSSLGLVSGWGSA